MPSFSIFSRPNYEPIARGQRLEKVEWPPFALMRPDFPDRLTVGPIDLTGPARFIYYGPYFALPGGRWVAELVIEVSDCFSDNQIAIDVVSGGVLAAVKAKLPARGIYSCELAFDIRAPSNPIEIRLQLLTGAIEGVLMLRQHPFEPRRAFGDRRRGERSDLTPAAARRDSVGAPTDREIRRSSPIVASI